MMMNLECHTSATISVATKYSLRDVIYVNLCHVNYTA